MHRLLIAFLFVLFTVVVGCDNDDSTTEVTVRVDETVDFTTFQTFSVVTSDLVDPPPDLGEDQEAFNALVNQVIIEAMQQEPVCLEFIPADQTSDQDQPDLWAANGLGQSTDAGYVYECCGGWWWGYWGPYWDPCAFWCPVYVEYDVGTLFVPVGLPRADTGDPEAVFAGLAQSIVGSGPDTATKVQDAIDDIFAQWPDPRSCP